ncbi:MAG: serine/threonine-protein kinase [Terriglobia bacterium]
MGRCASCGESVIDEARFCMSCGAPLASDPLLTADVATPPPTAAKRPSSQPRRSGGSSGTGKSTVVSRQGGFLPGNLLAGRYRIVAVLGKGGMGEVYRADDLMLEQPVALKFLPEAMDKDEDALERFRNEIRVARRVTHPNVCRVYDVGEVDGLTFLSMEYVDGEDLASLLRRIGRLVGDKGIEIARQLCAALAAAHREGVLHRDLKPANIMLDGRGRVVVTDFGLASLAERVEGMEARNGTPAYMAPEQLAGQEVTARSDIYSLGLVLYEIFTGKRAFAADTLAELVKQRTQQPVSTPSTWVRDLDPAVERIILRCLEDDPSKRPFGALAVAAALPGGDPLAEALAAGETPSPQMVAAAGEIAGLAPRLAITSLAAILLGLIAVVFIALKVSGLQLMIGNLPPEVLHQKAWETVEKLGYSAPALDEAELFYYDTNFTDYVHEHTKPRPDWPKVLAHRPPALLYSYRQSPVYLDPDGLHLFMTPGIVTFDDPPAIQSGMVNILLDAQGRLYYLQALPDEIESKPPLAHPMDWKVLFVAAGLNPDEFQSATPSRLPLASFDERAAWTGLWPATDFPLRVEAAAWQGKPVFFHMGGPWTTPDRTEYDNLTRGQHAGQIIEVIMAILLLGAGALVARRNYAKGKSDVGGAFRLASAVFVVNMALWVSLDHFIPTLATFGRFVLAVSGALFFSAAIWMLYIALEPYVRRHWPHALISWSRMLTGNLRDPLVGRDVLWGVLMGVLWSVIIGVGFLFLQREGATPQLPSTDLLMGSRQVLGYSLQNVCQSIVGTLQFFFLIFLLRVVLRNKWLALVCFVGIFTATNTLRSDHPQIIWPFWLLVYMLAAGAVTRFGLIVLATAIFTANVLLNLPYSLDFSTWYAPHAAVVVAGFVALAAWAFYTSLGSQKLWKDDLFE